MRLGVYGGTFSPVHLGHLIMAQDAMEQFELDEVLWVPCHIPSHKSTDSLPAVEHRVAMLDLALENDLRMRWSDMEILRGGTSYTIDSIRTLREEQPEDDLFFIIGSDSVFDLHVWKDIEELAKLCTFVTVARPGFDVERITAEETKLSPPVVMNLRAHVTVGHAVDISSSDIRARVAESLSIQYLVPDPVRMYIHEHHLYTS